jgi:glycosidase
MADFRELVDCVHHNDMRIILDGVFNHVGRGFFAFVDVLENGKNSPYKDWFHITTFPVNAYNESQPINYMGWWDHKSLPKLNTENKQVRKYILDVARIWDVNPCWANDGHFDGLTNYPFRDALVGFLQGRENAVQFDARLETLVKSYAREHLSAMYVPLDSHDTERFNTMVAGNIDKLKLAFQFQMAFPGAPAIYYGDEVGMEGGKDPDSRRAFPWNENEWNQDLRTWVKTLIALRKHTPCLRRGDFVRLLAKDGSYVFTRTMGDEKVIIAMNASSRARRVDIPCSSLGLNEGHLLHDLINGEKHIVDKGKISLNLGGWSGAWVG